MEENWLKGQNSLYEEKEVGFSLLGTFITRESTLSGWTLLGGPKAQNNPAHSRQTESRLSTGKIK